MTEQEIERMARRLCEADGYNPDWLWTYPSHAVVRSEGDKPVARAGSGTAPMWQRYRSMAYAVLRGEERVSAETPTKSTAENSA